MAGASRFAKWNSGKPAAGRHHRAAVLLLWSLAPRLSAVTIYNNGGWQNEESTYNRTFLLDFGARR